MGGSHFDVDNWSVKSSTMSSKSSSSIYTATNIKDEVNPSKMKNGIRESCDSDDNPNSTPLIIGLDCTGSMSQIPTYMIKTGLGELFKEIYTRKPISDPQVLFCTIGDVDANDPNPFSVGQFESQCDLLIDGLQKFWIDGARGGGNGYENYSLPYYFAANMTKTDSYIKRKRKGFIFTIGDEPPDSHLTPEAIQKVFGFKPESNVSFEQIINQVNKTWNAFHIILEEGSHVRSRGLDEVLNPWSKLLGQNAIVCSDHTKISEVIVSILEVYSGKNKSDVASSWDGSTSVVVANAISSLTVSSEDEFIIF